MVRARPATLGLMPLPSQEMIRRVRAARGAVNLSLGKFAKAIGVGRMTLVRVENGSRDPRENELRAMARVSHLPYGFFTAPDLDAVLGDAAEHAPGDRISLRDVAERLERLEATAGLPAATEDDDGIAATAAMHRAIGAAGQAESDGEETRPVPQIAADRQSRDEALG